MKHQPMRFLVAACAAGALTLAGCSGPQQSSTGPVDLRMTIWSANEGHLELFDSIAAEYVAEHDDVVSKITFETLAGDNYVGALTTQIAGGNAPDLAWVQETNASEFVNSGVLYELSPTLDTAADYDVPDILPGALEQWQKDGAIYAYPFSNSPFGMYANLDLIKAAGQPTPSELIEMGEWTWDKVAQVAAATAEQSGKGGLFVPYASWDQLSAWWGGWGAAGWSADGATCTFNSPEMIEFFDWMQEQTYRTGALIKPGDTYAFPAGDVAFATGQLSMSGGLEGFTWDWVPLPAGPKAQVSMVGQAGAGVIAQGKNPQVAADFLAYFTNKTQGRSWPPSFRRHDSRC